MGASSSQFLSSLRCSGLTPFTLKLTATFGTEGLNSDSWCTFPSATERTLIGQIEKWAWIGHFVCFISHILRCRTKDIIWNQSVRKGRHKRKFNFCAFFIFALFCFELFFVFPRANRLTGLFILWSKTISFNNFTEALSFSFSNQNIPTSTSNACLSLNPHNFPPPQILRPKTTTGDLPWSARLP